jgi:hypothetical protein
MQAPLITLLPEELFAISPEVCNQPHEAITPKRVLNRIHLSACDLPDTKSLTFCNTTYTHANWLTFTSDQLAPYTDLFLSAKEEYKPVAKKVHLVIGELPEKFWIEHKIISNPLDDLPVLNPNTPPFTPTDRYTLE